MCSYVAPACEGQERQAAARSETGHPLDSHLTILLIY